MTKRTIVLLLVIFGWTQFQQTADAQSSSASNGLEPPVRLKADGETIDIGKLSRYAHAGPALGDYDGDGDRDLLVGDFPGYFWLFENENNDENPVYTSKGKLKAGDADAKTPVY